MDTFLESQKVEGGEGGERGRETSVAVVESTNGSVAAMPPPPPQHNSDELTALKVENATLRVSHEKDEQIIPLLEDKNSLLQDKVALLERTLASLETRGGGGGRSEAERSTMTETQ